MISATSEFPQKLQRQVKGAQDNPQYFLENSLGITNFRETLMLSASSNEFSVGESYQEVANVNLNISEREEQLADRFDMTGILGHSQFLSNAHLISAGHQSQTVELLNPSFDEAIQQKADSNLDVDLQNNLKPQQFVERLERVVETKKTTPSKTVRGKKQVLSLDNLNRKSQNHIMDMSHVLDADGAHVSLNISSDISDGVGEASHNSVKTPIQSLLNTASSRAHTNQLLVAIQSLENGLRLYARVQNMSHQEQAELLVNARALLIENGFFDAEIVIDEFRPFTTQSNGGEEK